MRKHGYDFISRNVSTYILMHRLVINDNRNTTTRRTLKNGTVVEFDVVVVNKRRGAAIITRPDVKGT